MKMKIKNTKIIHLIRLAILPLCLIPTVSNAALIIDPTYTPQWITDDNSNFNASDVADLVGTSTILEEYYKANVGDGFDTGPFSDSYETTFFNMPDSALIEWVVGSDIIDCPECYLLVKDGNQSPAQYVFDIGTWDGMEDISLIDFWPEQGAISHIAIYGGVGDDGGGKPSVPEPSFIALLGMGLSHIRRKRKAA
ncbi:PEP-CTERM sorting domain-containing protein [Methylococcaceae bacterium CS4]|nr:PEP-CTERM sorting domain-containing protein [Methylococcaceae bacterium CS4]